MYTILNTTILFSNSFTMYHDMRFKTTKNILSEKLSSRLLCVILQNFNNNLKKETVVPWGPLKVQKYLWIFKHPRGTTSPN